MSGNWESAPPWYTKRKQAGLATSVERESDLLVKIWAVSALLPASDRGAFSQKILDAANKPDFGASQLVKIAATDR